VSKKKSLIVKLSHFDEGWSENWNKGRFNKGRNLQLFDFIVKQIDYREFGVISYLSGLTSNHFFKHVGLWKLSIGYASNNTTRLIGSKMV